GRTAARLRRWGACGALPRRAGGAGKPLIDSGMAIARSTVSAPTRPEQHGSGYRIREDADMNAYDDDQHDRPSSALSSATTGTTHPPDEPRSGVKRKAEEVAGRVRTEVDSAAHRLRRRARD